VRAAYLLDQPMTKGRIPRAQNIRLTRNGCLENGVVVRIAHDCSGDRGRVHVLADAFQKQKILINGSLRQRSACLHVRISEDPPHFRQYRFRQDEPVGAACDFQEKIAGQPLRMGFRVRADENIRVEDHPHCQLRRGRTAASAASSADSISSMVVSDWICEAISSR
jgi:hypothetical protein